jgi:small-conductance mechanosensitive channel
MPAPFRFPIPDPRPSAHVALLAAVCLVPPARGLAAEPPADDKPRPAETKKLELPRLTNEELLKQVDAILDKASRDYLACFRALAAAEARLEEVRGQTDDVPPAPGGRPAGEDPKKAVDAARTKQDVVRRQLKRVQTQKELLDRVAAGIEACRSAAVAFQNALDDLKAYSLETALRVKDGTLAEDKAPAGLKPESLYKKKRKVSDALAGLQTKSADLQKGQEAVARLLEETNRAALAADAELVEASRNLAREQQRQEVEKTYAGRQPDDLLAELARMVEEGTGLKGTYELALRKFDARAAEATRLRQELETLRGPDTKVPQLTRAEDVETAAKSLQELIGFHAARAKKIEDLRAVLAALAGEGGEFEADAAVSEEHLFKMQVLANLLRKNGVAGDRLPAKARAAELDPAAARQKQSAATVRATTEKARAELAVLQRQLAEAAAAREAAARQLANLKESQDVTLAALTWEGQLRALTGPRLVESFAATRKELADRLAQLKDEAEGYDRAAAVVEATARLDGLKDPFLRAAEEQGQAERQKLLGELWKEAGLERAAPSPLPLAPGGGEGKSAAASPPPGEGAGGPKKTDPARAPETDTRTELEKAAGRLLAFQQLLAGRVRVLDERAAKKKELLAALDELEKKATAYAKALADARLLALQSNATATELKKRLGKGELAGDAIPDGVTDALRLEQRAKLEATATTILGARNQRQQDRDRLLRPDPGGEALAAATRELLAVVGRRLDLLADLKRLAAENAREQSARPPSEMKRQEQLAAERQDAESSAWDAVLGIDSSKTAKDLSDLLGTYYRELIDVEEKEENLKKQREKVEQLLELTRQETAALARLLPLLARQVTQLESAREEAAVLARARLRPERAEELLRAYQTKTGRLPPRPAPLADRDKAERVEEMGELLFKRYVLLEAAKKWEGVLNARAAAGLKAEAGVYQDELARMNAAAAADARRVEALTGREGPGPAAGGEIARIRAELARARTHGVTRIGLKIAGILLAAFLLPWLLLWVLRRLLAGAAEDGPGLVLAAFRTILKATVWVGAVAMILSVLGFDVTAIVAGLGIGGLAIGLAAQSVIADVIGAVVIFAERRFKIGDVIRLEGDEPARVVGLTWRATQVKNADGLVVTIPNRKVTEATIQNLTRAGGTYDSLSVSVTTRQDADRVLAVLRRALGECEQVAPGQGVSVQEFNQKGEVKTIKYRFWWFLADYEARNKTRDEVFARVGASLAHEDMAGTEISLA